MRESVLTLDPWTSAPRAQPGRHHTTRRASTEPIQAHARLGVRKVLLSKLLPTVPHTQNSVGAINGEIELVRARGLHRTHAGDCGRQESGWLWRAAR